VLSEVIITVLNVRRVFFPLDRQLRLNDKHWSEWVAEKATKYSAKLSYEEATDALQELAEIEIGTSSIWRLTQKWGEKMKEVEAQEEKTANGTIDRVVTGKQPEKIGRLGSSMDGAMIYIRKEGWKELKVGCVFDVELAATLDPQTMEWDDLAHARNISYVSYLGGPESFGRKMWSEAKRRKWHDAIDTQVVGDGAVWIWNLVGDYFYDAHQLVDWYHANEHLATAAQLAFGENTLESKSWYKQQELVLFQGHAERIAQTIATLSEQKPETKDDLLQQAGYFANNQHRMNYLEMRADGWVIGSGMVESGGKRFKDRFAKSGMRWSREGAERLLPARGALMGKRFETLWKSAYNSPQN
jgi:hypothetical protein